MSAVAMMVSEPPSSMLRAAPRSASAAVALASRAAGEHFAGRRHHGVVGAAEPRDRVQQNHHVAAVLDQTLGLSITISAT
jgi:hypothetical protein